MAVKNTKYSKKKKQWVNPTLENEYELKMFKACTVYPRVRSFWIYTTINFFKTISPLPVCVLKRLSILKKKKIIYSVQRHMGVELLMASGLFTFGIRHIKVLFRGVAFLQYFFN